MKTKFILLLLLFGSCSRINYIERQANKGDINFCLYAVTHYTAKYNYEDDKKAQEKIVKYCRKGLSVKTDTSSFDPAIYYAVFYRELAKSKLTAKINKYAYYKKAAEYNDGESQWVTALYYLDGKGGKVNNDSALYWMKQAANGNSYIYSAMAQNELGDLYMEGKLVKPDTLTALYYYKRSCACNKQYSSLLACEKVIGFYNKEQNLKDTTELAVYRELAKDLRKINRTR